MRLIDKILPSEANNNYLGNRFAFFGLIFTTCLMTWRSFIHLLYQDAGLNSIGNIIIFEGIPDRDVRERCHELITNYRHIEGSISRKPITLI